MVCARGQGRFAGSVGRAGRSRVWFPREGGRRGYAGGCRPCPLGRAGARLGVAGREAPGWPPAADYAVRKIINPALSPAVAGIAGVLIAAAVAAGAVSAVRDGLPPSPNRSERAGLKRRPRVWMNREA